VPALAATVTIGVFGLFHSTTFDLEPYGPSRIEVRCGTSTSTLEGQRHARLNMSCTASGLNGTSVDFILSIPGKIRRHYQGTLETRKIERELLALVRMPLETAVASTVAAEAPPNASPAMLEAQAIVTRSYFSAPHNRHSGFEYCDTSHASDGHASAELSRPDHTGVLFRALRWAAGAVAGCEDRARRLPVLRGPVRLLPAASFEDTAQSQRPPASPRHVPARRGRSRPPRLERGADSCALLSRD